MRAQKNDMPNRSEYTPLSTTNVALLDGGRDGVKEEDLSPRAKRTLGKTGLKRAISSGDMQVAQSSSESPKVSPTVPSSASGNKIKPPKAISRCMVQWVDFLQEKVVITPDKSNVPLNVWELYMMMMLVTVAFHEPFVLAVGRPMFESNFEMALRRTFNRLVDVSFTLDLLLNFLIAYKNSTESKERAIWEKNPYKIAQRYLEIPFNAQGRFGWFWFDIISVIPVLLTLLQRIWRTTLVSERVDHVIRLTRLARITRMSTFKDVVERYQVSFGIPFYLSETLKFVFITVLTCHWAACICVICEGKVTKGYLSYHVDEDQKSWLSALIDSKGDSCIPSADEDAMCVYVLALYWATMTLTTVGYGDITPQNKVEYTLCFFFMLIAGFIWTYIVGSVVSLMSQVDPHAVRFRQNVDDINEVMSNRNLPLPLQGRLREYMLHAKEMFRWRDQRERLKMNISEGLLQEVAESTSVTGVLQQKVFWMRDLEQEAMLHIMAAFVPMLYAPKEVIKMKERMVIVRDGLMGVAGRVFGRDHVYGHDAILLQTEELTDHGGHMPTCLSFVYLLALEKKELLDICRNFPDADARLRRAQIRTAVWRNFIRCARQNKSGQSFEMALRGSASFAENTGGTQRGDNLVEVLKAQQVSLALVTSRMEAIEDKINRHGDTVQMLHDSHSAMIERLHDKDNKILGVDITKLKSNMSVHRQ